MCQTEKQAACLKAAALYFAHQINKSKQFGEDPGMAGEVTRAFSPSTEMRQPISVINTSTKHECGIDMSDLQTEAQKTLSSWF